MYSNSLPHRHGIVVLSFLFYNRGNWGLVTVTHSSQTASKWQSRDSKPVYLHSSPPRSLIKKTSGHILAKVAINAMRQTPKSQQLSMIEVYLQLISNPVVVLCVGRVSSTETVKDPGRWRLWHLQHLPPELPWMLKSSQQKGEEREGTFLWIRPGNTRYKFYPFSVCQQSILQLGNGVWLSVWEESKRIWWMARSTLLPVITSHLNKVFPGTGSSVRVWWL